jgi:tRNA(Ile)-lysidine synthase
MPRRRKIDWPAMAVQLAGAIPKVRLHPAVLAWAEKSPSQERWCVGFSGGADSLALLLLLWAHWPERRSKLAALHFNHRLRGASANADERFCREVAESLAIKWNAGAWKNAPRIASEAEARAARHRFFNAALRRLRTHVLGLGHQQDDIAETMLMRLARGSGTGGLAAPRPVQPMPEGVVFLRPLLSLKKADLIEQLRRLEIPWREDATNRERTYLRNRLRRDVLPAWQRASQERDVLGGAALSRERLEEDDVALEAWLTELNPISKDGSLNLRRLHGRPRGLVRRALHHWLGVSCPQSALSRQAFTALLTDLMARRITRHSLGRQVFAKIGKHRMVIERGRAKLSN